MRGDLLFNIGDGARVSVTQFVKPAIYLFFLGGGLGTRRRKKNRLVQLTRRRLTFGLNSNGHGGAEVPPPFAIFTTDGVQLPVTRRKSAQFDELESRETGVPKITLQKLE